MNELGHNIAKLREKYRMNQTEFGEKLNVSKAAVGLWETNRRIPPLDRLIEIAKLFNVSVDDLLRGDYDAANVVSLPMTDAHNIEITLSPAESKILKTFRQLNEDNQDIVIGEAKKLLREQQIEEKRVTPEKSAV